MSDSTNNMHIRVDWTKLAISKGKSLPHWRCEDSIYHFTFRLHDSIPSSTIRRWRRERDILLKRAGTLDRKFTEQEIRRVNLLFSQKVDNFLDSGHGDCLFRQSAAANIVCSAIKHYHEQVYNIHAYCVMPNHVHLIAKFFDQVNPQRIVTNLLRYSARKINTALARSGKLWQHEAYDHIIRSPKEYRRQIQYVMRNPEHAGITRCPWRENLSHIEV